MITPDSLRPIRPTYLHPLLIVDHHKRHRQTIPVNFAAFAEWLRDVPADLADYIGNVPPTPIEIPRAADLPRDDLF